MFRILPLNENPFFHELLVISALNHEQDHEQVTTTLITSVNSITPLASPHEQIPPKRVLAPKMKVSSERWEIRIRVLEADFSSSNFLSHKCSIYRTTCLGHQGKPFVIGPQFYQNLFN